MMRTLSMSFAALVVAVAGGVASADVVGYDQMTTVSNNNWLIPSSAATAPAPTGSGNRQIGGFVNLAGTDTQITGFDLAVVNATGAAISNSANTVVRLNWSIWSTVTPGTSVSTLAMSNLAGTGTATLSLGGLAAPFGNNQLLFLGTGPSGGAGLPPTAGTMGGINFAPVSILQTTGIGVSFSWDLSTDGGLTFISPNGLTSLITGGQNTTTLVTTPAPTVGSNGFALPGAGYYRSPQSTTTDLGGNFAQGSSRNVGVNSGVVMRIYTVPAPAAAGLLGLGGLVAARRRRQS